MFVETKREGEEAVKTEVSFTGLLGWLERQPADGVYSFEQPNACVAGLYYASIGIPAKQWLAGPRGVSRDLDVPDLALLNALGDEPRTFGGALERLRAL